MTVFDSSLLIDYLDGEDFAVTYLEEKRLERAVTIQLVLFEVYQGEVYKSGPTDFDAVDGALRWLTVVEGPPGLARTAASLQESLQQEGSSLSARDAFIAGAAKSLGETLAVSDADFDNPGLRDVLDVDVVSD